MQKLFKIEVKEMLSRVIEVEANTEEEAIEEVEARYNNEDIVLDYNDFVEVNINSLK